MHRLFENYVLRTPLLSINEYLNLTSESEVNNSQLRNLFQRNIVKESLYLASPSLYRELEKKFISDDPELTPKLKNTFLKYISRMSSRPTPFGLFSGCSLGKFENNDLIIRDNSLNSRSTRLDMNLMGILIRKISDTTEIRNKLVFYTNTSLYQIGNLIRFVESKYSSGGLSHQLIEVQNSEILNAVIKSGNNGMQVEDFTQLILTYDIEIELSDAENFVNELIDSQILVSELQQTVSGTENIDHLIAVLRRIDVNNSYLEMIKDIKSFVNNLDHNIINHPSIYTSLIDKLEKLEIKFNKKYIIQSDLNIGLSHNYINKDFKETIYDGLEILNKISQMRHKLTNHNLEKFKKEFYERYETKEVSLANVIDNELGLGYPVSEGAGDSNYLLDNLRFAPISQTSNSITLDEFDKLLIKKIMACEHDYSVIEIKDSDLKTQKMKWDDLPDTFSSVTQKVYIDNKEFLHMNFITGSSACNLITRFCHGNKPLRDYTRNIIKKETELSSTKILAEISHLPEDRLGNILMRPSFRKYEIPYLSRPTLDIDQQIGLKDLTISLRNNLLILKSKKHGKEVLPRLTSAHNFSKSNLPFYRFLGDMQSYQIRNKMVFDWDNLSFTFDYFPRVIYKNIILSTAKWKIDSSYLTNMKEYNGEKLLSEIKLLREKYNLKKLVYFVEGDNKLLINLNNITSIKSLINSMNRKDFFFLEEFLFDEKAHVVNSVGDKYVNELIFSFYKN